MAAEKAARTASAPAEPPKKLGYARVSTVDQNLDLQRRALEGFGCDEIFVDDGISAVARRRPALEELFGKLRPGDMFVVWKMDRAFRSLSHALMFLEDLEVNGVDFVALTERIDTTTPMGRFVYQINSAFAELERAMIRERTIAGLDAARARGAHLGRPDKLTAAEIDSLRALYAEGNLTMDKVGDMFGVSRSTVSRIVARARASAETARAGRPPKVRHS